MDKVKNLIYNLVNHEVIVGYESNCNKEKEYFEKTNTVIIIMLTIFKLEKLKLYNESMLELKNILPQKAYETLEYNINLIRNLSSVQEDKIDMMSKLSSMLYNHFGELNIYYFALFYFQCDFIEYLKDGEKVSKGDFGEPMIINLLKVLINVVEKIFKESGF